MNLEDLLGKAYKHLVRIPVGNTKENREEYIENVSRIFPNNEMKKFEDQCDLYSMKGILQIMIDVRYGVVLFTMRCHPHTGLSEWQIASDFLKSINHAKDYEIPTQEDNYDYPDPDGESSGIIDNGEGGFAHMDTTPMFDVDVLLSMIAQTGYESLNDDEKEFLKGL